MKRVSQWMLLGGALLFASAAPAAAQSGFALKGGLVFNEGTVNEARADEQIPQSNGFHVGLEYVLPLGIGVGVSGYTVGAPEDFDTGEGALNFLAEANYFFKLPILPIAPYAGVHVGLGTYSLGEVADGPEPEVDFGDLGYQVGVRIQPTRLIGIDAQYRRVSGSLAENQEASFESDQFVVGITLF